MWIERLLTSRTTQAIELTAQFAERRHGILAENVANVATPDYHTQQLDPEEFQAALREALQRAEAANESRLDLRGDAQFSTTGDGRVVVKPSREPAPNVLFHDGTNARLEALMADVAENALSYELATSLLRGRFNTMLTAIRGRNA
jgi:flagellar basal-body rod protein FlgB